MCLHKNYLEFGYSNIQTIDQLDIDSFYRISTRDAPELDLKKMKFEFCLSRNRRIFLYHLRNLPGRFSYEIGKNLQKDAEFLEFKV